MWLLKAIGLIIFSGTVAAFLYLYVCKISTKIMLYRSAYKIRKMAERQPEGEGRDTLLLLAKEIKQAARDESLTDDED